MQQESTPLHLVHAVSEADVQNSSVAAVEERIATYTDSHDGQEEGGDTYQRETKQGLQDLSWVVVGNEAGGTHSRGTA